MITDFRLYPAIRVNMSELRTDPEFAAWLNDPRTRVWTWHEKGNPVDDFSDIVVWVESNGEGSESGDMPEHIWNEIAKLMGGRCGLCWITFMENLQ